MTHETDTTEKDQIIEGTKEAAAWALHLLDADSSAAALDLADRLRQCPPARRAALLLGLVNLSGRLGVRSPDVASLKVALRYVASEQATADVEACYLGEG